MVEAHNEVIEMRDSAAGVTHRVVPVFEFPGPEDVLYVRQRVEYGETEEQVLDRAGNVAALINSTHKKHPKVGQ